MLTPIRQLMAGTRLVDTSSWTTVYVGRPDRERQEEWVPAGASVEFYRAVVAEGRSAVAVDWGDGTGIDYYEPGAGREVTLAHVYNVRRHGFVVRISDDLSEFYPSHAEFASDWYNGSSTSAMVPTWMNVFEGAELVSNVLSLGSRVTNRTFSIGMFANTEVYCMPEPYGFPSLTPLADAPCVPAMCFLNCKKLKTVRELTGVKVIDASAFEGCEYLEDTNPFNPRALVHIGPKAFLGCRTIRQLHLWGDSGLAPNQDTVLFGKQLSSFTEADISVASQALGVASSPKFARFRINYFNFPVGAQAFMNCSDLRDLSNSVNLGSGAFFLPDTFSGCTRLDTSLAGSSSLFRCLVYSQLNYPHAWAFGSPTTRVLSSSDYYSCRNGGETKNTSSLFVDSTWAFFRRCSYLTYAPAGPHTQSGAQLVSSGTYENLYSVTGTVTLASSIQRIGAGAFSGSGVDILVLQGKTKAQAQGIMGVRGICYIGYDSPTYPFGLKSGAIVRCTDGDLTV